MKLILNVRVIKAFEFYVNNNLIIPNCSVPVLMINGHFPDKSMDRFISLLPMMSDRYDGDKELQVRNINNCYLKNCHMQKIFSEIEKEFSELFDIIKCDINNFYTKNLESIYNTIVQCFKSIRILLSLILQNDRTDNFHTNRDKDIDDKSTIEIYMRYDINVRCNHLNSNLAKILEYFNQLLCVLNNEILIENIPYELVKSAHILFCTLSTAGMRRLIYSYQYKCM